MRTGGRAIQLARAAAVGASVAVCAGAVGSATARASAAAPPIPPRPADNGNPSLLLEAGATREQRSAAARRALASDSADARSLIERALRDGPGDARATALRELATLSTSPRWTEPLVVPLLSAPGPETRLAAYAAAGSLRSRAVAAALVRRLGEAPRSEAAAIRRALVRMSGRTDLGLAASAWEAWLNEAASGSEEDWLRYLVRSLAERADEQSRTSEAVASRLANELRRSYLSLAAGPGRSAMLVALLGDELTAVRRAGLQLATQELASGRAPSEDVAEAVLARLSDSSPDLRAMAAELINRLPASPSLGPAVNAALREESDADAAARLLPASARWPEEESLPTSLVWLDGTGPARDAAILAVDAFERRGMLTKVEDRARVLGALRGVRPADLPGAGLRLLFKLGEAEDRAAATALLRHESEPVRIRAGEALVGAPGALESLLSAAAEDSSLFAPASAAISLHQPTKQGYDTLAGLPAPSPEARREALLMLATRMPVADVLEAARGTDDLEFREELLLRMRPESATPVPGSGTLFNPRALLPVAEGAVLLARTRLELGQPAAALTALDAVGPTIRMINPDGASEARCCALLQLNRLGEAEAIAAPAGAWLEGLERSVALPHAATIVTTIERLFGAGLAGADRTRLDGLAERVRLSAEFVGPPTP